MKSRPSDQQLSSWAPNQGLPGQDEQVVSGERNWYLNFQFMCFTSKVARFLITKSSIVMLRLMGTGSVTLRNVVKAKTVVKPPYWIGSMLKCGTSKGSRGGMPKSGIPEKAKLLQDDQTSDHLWASGSWAARGWQQCTRPLQGPWWPSRARGWKEKARPTQSCDVSN